MPVSFSPPANVATLDRVVVTGAFGFVGRHLLPAIGVPIAPLSLSGDDWRQNIQDAAFHGATVLHLAARVHQGGQDEANYFRDNAEKTRVLAEEAARRGARRLVFLSTIKVHGEETRGTPFRPGDPPAPADGYARSKHEAEQALHALAATSPLQVVVVRSPLVVGPAARGNLEALRTLADSGWPLPLGALANRRTLVDGRDLARLLALCATHPDAVGGTWLAGHPDPISTTDLLRAARIALGRPSRLWPVPAVLLEAGAGLLGKGELMRRLTRSLEVDVSETMARLGWQPEVTPAASIAALARAWRQAPA